ncbi:MAG: hypothetical protein ABGY42_17110 [bacterium]
MSDTSEMEATLPEADELDPFADDGTSILLQEDTPSDSLLIAFGGLFGSVAVPVYEFAKFARSLDAKGMFLRDPHRAWYFRGLPESGDDLASVERILAEHIERIGASRVVAVGASAGAFAAMHFGARLGFDEVHAFSPQTTVAKWHRFRLGDKRWKKDIANIHSSPAQNRPFEDLVPTLEARQPGTTFHIHYCHREPLDVAHAMRVCHIDDVFLHAYAQGDHKVIRWLKKRGDLKRILQSSLLSP